MKKEVLKGRSSLTLLYSVIVFCILFVSIIVAVAIAVLFSHLGIVSFDPPDSGIRFGPLTFMALVSLAVGLILTLLTRNIPLSPINALIDSMNRLKSGDFKVRLNYDGKLKSYPLLLEIKDSFNTMAQELENTEMLRSDFINNFSHEFKTPIVSIAGFAKLLRRGNLSEEQKEEYLAIIEEESLRLSYMATNVLSLTKVENQSILSDVSSFNLSEQIRSCVLLLEDQWSRKEIVPNLDFEEHNIRGNEELLKQVWINLIDNAVKFSPITGEIDIGIDDKGESLLVTVTNYGEEIPPDKQDKIWGKFYQADESHSSMGNGVGLAIVRSIVRLHRGKASVQSENGRTSFMVELPKNN